MNPAKARRGVTGDGIIDASAILMHFSKVLPLNSYLHWCRYAWALVPRKTDLVQISVCTVFDTKALVQTRICTCQPSCLHQCRHGRCWCRYVSALLEVCELVQTYSWPGYPKATFSNKVLLIPHIEFVLSLSSISPQPWLQGAPDDIDAACLGFTLFN